METYKVFTLQGFDVMTPDGGLVNVVTLELMGDNYTQAMAEAIRITKEAQQEKPNWRLKHVIQLPVKK